MEPNVDPMLTDLQQKNAALSQRLAMLQNRNTQLMNRNSVDLLPNQHPLQQSCQQLYQQPHYYPSQQPYQRQLSPVTYVYPSSSRAVIQPTMDVIGNITGWQVWSCCLFWFGLLNLLGGVTMIIVGAIETVNWQLCRSPYTVTYNDQCCYYNNSYYYQTCYNPNTSVLTTGIILLCVGFVSAIVGIVLLFKARKMYRNNNEICCSSC